MQVSYEDGRGLLRDILVHCTQNDAAVTRVQVDREGASDDARENRRAERQRAKASPDVRQSPSETSSGPGEPRKQIVTVGLELRGVRSIAKLVSRLSEIDGVAAVKVDDTNFLSE